MDVGELPPPTGSTEPDDPRAPLDLTAHAVARVADRFAPLRKLSRHMEGSEKRAGLLSDCLAVLYALYKRNPEAAEHLFATFHQGVQQRQAARRAPANGGANVHTPQPGGIHAS